VIGHFYYSENLSSELQAEIQALGFDPGQFLIHKISGE